MNKSVFVIVFSVTFLAQILYRKFGLEKLVQYLNVILNNGTLK